MNILVTGSHGQLGTEMQQIAQTCFGAETVWHFTDIEDLDITDAAAIQQFVNEKNIHFIVNCAAYTAVDKAEAQEDLCRKVNAVAPGLLAEAIAQRNGGMIHISTDYVFDGTACRPYTEDHVTAPQSAYGRTKLEGEQNVMQACPNSVILRTAWLYSPYGNNFVKTMLRLGREKQTLGVVADQIGAPTSAHTLAQVIAAILKKGIVPGIYHFSNEGVTSWYDFTCAIHDMAGITSCHVRPIHTEDYPTPAHRPAYSVLDKTKIKETYQIDIPWWQDALRACLKELGEIQ